MTPHPFSELFPPISDEDFDKLAADIKLHGLHQPIVRYQGKILDGNNRYRACGLVKVAPKFTDFDGDDAQARNYVISANIHRRHLSADQRRDIIATLLKADPTQSNRQIADAAKVSHHTVEDVRAELEVGGQIAHQQKTIGKDGVVQPKKKKSSKQRGGGKTTVSYQEVINAKTALNAYNVLEQHLLDALQDIKDKSDFSQAEDYARRTITELEDKLSDMQPEMADAAE